MTSSFTWRRHFAWLTDTNPCPPRPVTPYCMDNSSLVIRLMEVPSVSGATDYACLCMADVTRRENRQNCRGGEPTTRRPNNSLLLHPITLTPVNLSGTPTNPLGSQQPSTPRLQGHHNPSQTSALKGPRLHQDPDPAVVPISIAGSWGTSPETAQNPRERVQD